MIETFYKDFIDLLGSKPEIALSCFILGAIFWGMIIRRENKFFKVQAEIFEKQLKEVLSANRKYEIEIVDIKPNTLYEVTEISNAMVMEIPDRRKIRILGSYSKPCSKEEIKNLSDVGRHQSDALVLFSDMPKYLYLKFEGEENISNIRGKGFTVKSVSL